MMAFLLAAYDEDEVNDETRTVLRLHPRLAPYKVAVLPLSKKDELIAPSQEVLALLQPRWMCDYDETQAIGRRYRRQDELGTPYCVTIDFDSARRSGRDRSASATPWSRSAFPSPTWWAGSRTPSTDAPSGGQAPAGFSTYVNPLGA